MALACITRLELDGFFWQKSSYIPCSDADQADELWGSMIWQFFPNLEHLRLDHDFEHYLPERDGSFEVLLESIKAFSRDGQKGSSSKCRRSLSLLQLNCMQVMRRRAQKSKQKVLSAGCLHIN